jgi:hypothetical protein
MAQSERASDSSPLGHWIESSLCFELLPGTDFSSAHPTTVCRGGLPIPSPCHTGQEKCFPSRFTRESSASSSTKLIHQHICPSYPSDKTQHLQTIHICSRENSTDAPLQIHASDLTKLTKKGHSMSDFCEKRSFPLCTVREESAAQAGKTRHFLVRTGFEEL